MANAVIHNYTFLIDPTSASWGYTLNVKTYDTYGGRVIQTLSCKIDQLTLGGYLQPPSVGEDRYANMLAFESKVKEIMDYQSATKRPVWFDYPALDWGAWVYLTGYKDVKYDVATSAISYSLTFDVDNGFESLVTTAESYGLDLINSGVEYVKNEFNTPSITWDELRIAYEKLLKDAGTLNLLDSIYDYLDKEDSEGADGSSDSAGDKKTGNGSKSMADKVIGGSDKRAVDVVLNGSKVNHSSEFYKSFGALARVGAASKA